MDILTVVVDDNGGILGAIVAEAQLDVRSVQTVWIVFLGVWALVYYVSSSSQWEALWICG